MNPTTMFCFGLAVGIVLCASTIVKAGPPVLVPYDPYPVPMPGQRWRLQGGVVVEVTQRRVLHGCSYIHYWRVDAPVGTCDTRVAERDFLRNAEPAWDWRKP